MKNIKVNFAHTMEGRTADMLLDAVNTAIIDDVNYTVYNGDNTTLYFAKNNDVLDYIAVCVIKGVIPSMITFKYKNGLEVNGKAYHLNRTSGKQFDTLELTGVELPRF